MKIEVGNKVRDRVTGFEGIAVARTVWLNKCVRIVVQPQQLHDGKPIDNQAFDEEQLVMIEADPLGLFKEKAQTGGPMPDVATRPEVKRL